MKFVLYDKSEYEMDIITDILEEEKIGYKTQRHAKQFMDCPIGKAFIMVYDIEVSGISYEHLEFIKYLADKRIKNRCHIEKCYDMFENDDEQNISSWAKSIIDIIKKC